MPLPQVEIVTQAPPSAPPEGLPGARRPPRIRVFLAVFLTAMLLGQAINLSRPAVYRSSATVLTVAQPAVDEVSVEEELDLQHVAIQRQLLLGRPLLEQVLTRLQQTDTAQHYGLGDVSQFQHMLAVAPIPSTHLVELLADGDQPELLPRLVNSWIEAYLAFRENAIEEEVGETLTALTEQYGELGGHIAEKRREIEAYRERHEILSQGRTENRAHATLQGLNDALNKAREQEVATRATLDAVEQALAAGEPIMPEGEEGELIRQQVELQTLEQEYEEYRKRYTAEYMMVDEEFQKLPAKIRKLKAGIRSTIEQGQQMLQAQTRHEAQTAIASVLDLERRLSAHKREAAEFTARFAQYEAMAEDLAGLEAVYREVEQRRARIESQSLEKYPQVQVVEWAYTPTSPLHPDYLYDGILVLAGSVLLGLFAVWLLEYLGRGSSRDGAQAAPAMAGIRVFSEPAIPLENAQAAPPTLQAGGTEALASPAPRELTEPEVEALWRSAEPADRLGLALLLCGLTPEEIAGTSGGDFDPASGLLRINGPGQREIPMPESCHELLSSQTGTPDDLDAQVRLLAYDAGLPYPEQVNAATLRHTYILYLVRQGARLRELERLVGPMTAQSLMSYGPYSPKGAGRSLDDLETCYPVLAAHSR